MNEQAGPSGIERGGSGDSQALAEAFESHRQDVRRLCRRMLGDETAAEDAASETFLRAQQRLESYDPARSLRTWLLSIAAHYCVDLLRRRTREERIFEDAGPDAADLAGAGPSPLRHVLLAEQRAAVLAAIDGLPAKYRLPLVLRHFADLDYDGIAAVLGVSRSQVGTLVFRARRRLREELGGME